MNYVRGLVLPVTIIGAILVFVVPIPPLVLDVLLSANVTVAVVVLLTTLAIRTPAGVQRVSDDPADHDADPAGPERGDDAAGPDARRRRGAGRGRRRDPRLRRVRRRRPGHRRA